MPGSDNEFAEFETDEATIDRMMAEGEPAEIVDGPLDANDSTSASAATVAVTTELTAFLAISASVSTTSSGRPLRRACQRLRPHQGADRTQSTRETVAS